MEKWHKQINKAVGKDVLLKGNQVPAIPRIPTGSLSLDVETGGGVPIGKITTVAGDYATGKTALVLKVVAEFQKLWPNKEVVWEDAEGAWDPIWAEALGVDVERVTLAYPEYQEQAFDIALKAIENDAGLLVIDSIAALSPKSEAESDMETQLMGLPARLNKKWLRKAQGALLRVEETGDFPTTIVLVNQLYSKMSMYGGQTESGGTGLEYYPSLKLRLKQGDLYPKSISVSDEGVEPKAQSIKFFTEKNKTAPRHRRGHYWLYFDRLDEYRPKGSIDRIEEVVRYAAKFDITVKRGSYYDVVDKETGEVLFTSQGQKGMVDKLREDIELREYVENQVMEIVNGKEAANISKELKRQGKTSSDTTDEQGIREEESEGDRGESSAE